VTNRPRGVRPKMGEAFDLWAPEGGKGSVLEWPWVQERMYGARSYWVVTTPRSGPPHAMPVWGVFVDDVFYFSTPGSSKKARNIERTGDATVHLESADIVVIVEGTARAETEPELTERLAAAFFHKYRIEIVGKFPDQVMYSIRPRRVMAWQGFPESEFMRTMTRFDLD
jgi:general stress protein 26